MGLFKKKENDNPIDAYFDRDLMKKVLDYNQDNIVDVKDIVELSNDIESSFSKYNDLLKNQIEDVKSSII